MKTLRDIIEANTKLQAKNKLKLHLAHQNRNKNVYNKAVDGIAYAANGSKDAENQATMRSAQHKRGRHAVAAMRARDMMEEPANTSESVMSKSYAWKHVNQALYTNLRKNQPQAISRVHGHLHAMSGKPLKSDDHHTWSSLHTAMTNAQIPSRVIGKVHDHLKQHDPK